MSIHQMFDITFSQHEKDTIQHIARFWEQRVRDFPPSLYLDHYTNTKAICDEIAHIKQQRLQYKKSLTKEQRRELKAYRSRFENEHINPTLAEQRLVAWANDCYEPLNLRDNGIIQREWRETYMEPYMSSDIPISYE
jgi:hypothetical protein